MPVEELEAIATGADEGADDGVGEEIEGEQPSLDDADGIDDADAGEEDGEQSDEDQAEEEAEPEQQEVAGDGRRMPDALKKGFAELKKIDPAAAKAMKGTYFAEQEYRSAFALPADAVAAKTMLDQVGGAEGIQQIEAERAEWQEIDGGFAEASPAFYKGLAENNPEAFIKGAPHVINEWASRAPEQYGYFATQVALNTVLQQPGMEQGIGVLAKLHDQLAEAPWAQQAIANVVNGIVGMRDKAQQFEQKRVDPERAKLETEKQSWEQQKRVDFETGIAAKAEMYLGTQIPEALKPVINGRNVDPEAMKGYTKMVQDEVERRLADIPGFEGKLEAFYRAGNASESVKYIQKQYERILPEAAKVVAPFLRNIPAAKPTVGTQSKGQAGERRPAAQGEITLKEMPDFTQLDPAFRADPNHVAELMQGRAILKGGKKASGWA